MLSCSFLLALAGGVARAQEPEPPPMPADVVALIELSKQQGWLEGWTAFVSDARSATHDTAATALATGFPDLREVARAAKEVDGAAQRAAEEARRAAQALAARADGTTQPTATARLLLGIGSTGWMERWARLARDIAALAKPADQARGGGDGDFDEAAGKLARLADRAKRLEAEVRGAFEGATCQANQANALANVTKVHKLQQRRRAAGKPYAAGLGELAAESQGELRQGFAAGRESGYVFRMVPAGDGFRLLALPEFPGKSGKTAYMADRYNIYETADGTEPTEKSPVVGEDNSPAAVEARAAAAAAAEAEKARREAEAKKKADAEKAAAGGTR